MELYIPKILYGRGVIPKLARRFGVTEQTVRSAFRFATEGDQPDLIRQTAIKEYGCLLSKKPIYTEQNNQHKNEK